MALDRVRDSLWSTTLRHVGHDSFHLPRGSIATPQSIISDLLYGQQRKRRTCRAHFIWPCFAAYSSLRWGDEISFAPLHSSIFPLQSGDIKLLLTFCILGKKNQKRDGKCLKPGLPYAYPFQGCGLVVTFPSLHNSKYRFSSGNRWCKKKSTCTCCFLCAGIRAMNWNKVGSAQTERSRWCIQSSDSLISRLF